MGFLLFLGALTIVSLGYLVFSGPSSKYERRDRDLERIRRKFQDR